MMAREDEVMAEDTEGYLRSWIELAALVAVGRYADALATAERMQERYPERATQVARARASLLSATGRTDEALSMVAEVVARGGWWSERGLADPDLDALRSRPAFAEAAATMRERGAASLSAAVQATSSVRVIRPRMGVLRAVVVVLHMHGVGGEQTADVWAPVADDGVLLVVPESTLHDGDGRPCWDDQVLTTRDVCHAVARGRVEGDAPLVLAGGSQGARRAAELAIAGTVPCVGFLAVVGAPPPHEVEPHLAAAAARRLRSYFVGGGADGFTLPRQHELHQRLVAAGVASQLQVIEGMPHVYPPNWPAVAHEALHFLLAAQ